MLRSYDYRSNSCKSFINCVKDDLPCIVTAERSEKLVLKIAVAKIFDLGEERVCCCCNTGDAYSGFPCFSKSN